MNSGGVQLAHSIVQEVRSASNRGDDRSQCALRRVASYVQFMVAQLTKQRQLLVKRRNHLWIGQSVATAGPAASNCAFDIDLQHYLVNARRESSEGVQEPWPDHAIHNHKVTALRVTVRRLSQYVDDDVVLPVRRLQKRRDGSMLDEVPKVIRVKMHFGQAWHRCQSFGCSRFPRTRSTGEDEDLVCLGHGQCFSTATLRLGSMTAPQPKTAVHARTTIAGAWPFATGVGWVVRNGTDGKNSSCGEKLAGKLALCLRIFGPLRDGGATGYSSEHEHTSR